jgi:hypothetical protein
MANLKASVETTYSMVSLAEINSEFCTFFKLKNALHPILAAINSITAWRYIEHMTVPLEAAITKCRQTPSRI